MCSIVYMFMCITIPLQDWHTNISKRKRSFLGHCCSPYTKSICSRYSHYYHHSVYYADVSISHKEKDNIHEKILEWEQLMNLVKH